jgi:hypothetical protein
MSALQDVQSQLDRTAGVIEGFRRSVAEGSVIDLAGLDRGIEEMCEAIKHLPADQRIKVKDTLIGLIDDLNNLVEALHAQQHKVSEALGGITSRQKAVSAYGKSHEAARSRKGGPAK